VPTGGRTSSATKHCERTPSSPPFASSGRCPGRGRELSHGEAFLALLGRRATSGGLYLLDEPDAALSFTGTLSLVLQLAGLVDRGAQVVVATHSPVLAALPGARLLEVGDWGLREASWAELELTASWRQFLGDPESFLRYLS
jgi:predicted ATPase